MTNHPVNFIDRTGQKFGSLTVKEYVGDRKWLCVCDCGREIVVQTGHLTSGHTKSCGKHRPPRLNLVNQKFGKLTVLEWAEDGRWLCQCECGNLTKVKTYNLTSGNTKSCGCYQK